jgi:hypothetical protein
MQDRPTHTDRGFDLDEWREKLLALNPWAHGLTIGEDNDEFAGARQNATLARHAEGRAAWNTWANAMLAAKSVLERAGGWESRPGYYTRTSGRFIWEPESGGDAAAQAWLSLARAVFSTDATPHFFDNDASFAGLIFPDEARFQRATFAGEARFEGTAFNSGAWFQGVNFNVGALFESITFSSVAQFQGATFGRGARFQGATFRGRAWFQGKVFLWRTFFSGARFDADAIFAHARFEGPADFAGATFRRRADFDGIDCAAAFSLADATFKEAPGFIGATFKGTLRLDNVETPRYRGTLGYTPDKDATARFRELRRRALEAQDRDRELEFFAQEIRTGRFHAKGLPSWVPKVWSWRFWFGLGFGALSDFGRSLWRPLLWWLALTALFAAFFVGEHEDMRKDRAALAPHGGAFSAFVAYAITTRKALANPPACRIQGREPFSSTDAVTEAIQASLKNALVFNIGSTDSARRTLGCLFGLDDRDLGLVPARVSTASTLQALASGLLIFLFLLAVRNLLRLK